MNDVRWNGLIGYASVCADSTGVRSTAYFPERAVKLKGTVVPLITKQRVSLSSSADVVIFVPILATEKRRDKTFDHKYIGQSALNISGWRRDRMIDFTNAFHG